MKGMLVIIHFFTKSKILISSILIILLLAVAILVLLCFVYPQLIYELDSVRNWNRYSVRTYRKDYRLAYFEVLLGYRKIYSCSGKQKFYVESLGSDVTGNGVPNIIIRQWYGSAHGDSRYLALELDGSKVKEIDIIDGLLDVEFQDLNNDGLPEIMGIDRAYGYFLGDSFAASPCPSVVMSFDKTREKQPIPR